MNNSNTYLSSCIYSYFTIIKEIECFCEEEEKFLNSAEDVAVLKRIKYYNRKSKRVGLDFFSEVCSLMTIDIETKLRNLEQIQVQLIRSQKMFYKFINGDGNKSYTQAITGLYLLRKQIHLFIKGDNSKCINTIANNHHQNFIKQSLEYLESLKSYIHIRDIDICQN